MIPEHEQYRTLRLKFHYPEHEPRESDPHYLLFNQTRQRLKEVGRLVCWRCGAKDRVELHHSIVEYAVTNALDVNLFIEMCPEFHVTDQETFLQFVESEGNLLPLCMECHRGTQGIHSIPYPDWVPGRYLRKGAPPIAVVISCPAERTKSSAG